MRLVAERERYAASNFDEEAAEVWKRPIGQCLRRRDPSLEQGSPASFISKFRFGVWITSSGRSVLE